MASSSTLERAARPAARIVGAFGYRVEGDTACLNAEIDWGSQAADGGAWCLQLCAQPLDAPGAPVVVATLPVTVPLHTHGEPFCVEGYVMALPPAGTGQHEMSLQLVATRPGAAPQLHDRAVFAQPERFVQPRLEGPRLTQGAGDSLAMVVERVRNPRPPDNLSGSLSLELWAVAQPYHGGPFDGRCIASVQLEALAGQSDTGPVVMPVPATPADRQRPWCLMLREWTAVGYVTRDHAALVAPAPAVARVAATAAPAAASGPAATPLPRPVATVAAPSHPPAGRRDATAPGAPVAAAVRSTSAAPRTAHRSSATSLPVAVPPGLASRLMANLRHFLQR